jgi:hypothetical protein
MSPKIQKITPQRFRIVSLTRGNVAPIFANRTSPAETGLAGWGGRTRTSASGIVRDWAQRYRAAQRVTADRALDFQQACARCRHNSSEASGGARPRDGENS